MGTAKTDQAGKVTTPDNIRSMSAHMGLCFLYGLLGFSLSLFVLLGTESRELTVIGTTLLMLMLGIMHGVIAFGAARATPWARKSSMVVGCLMLLGFPIGTIIGVYLLANLTWPRAEQAMK